MQVISRLRDASQAFTHARYLLPLESVRDRRGHAAPPAFRWPACAGHIPIDPIT
jgi:hypothetical protein